MPSTTLYPTIHHTKQETTSQAQSSSHKNQISFKEKKAKFRKRLRGCLFSPFGRQLMGNLALGLLIFSLLLLFRSSPSLMELEDASMDWLMRVNSNIIPPILENDIPPFVVLDIDDETYQEWDRPLMVGRDKIVYLLDAAVKAQARLVMLILDVQQTTPQYNAANEQGVSLHPNDELLKNYLANYAQQCKVPSETKACPPIILIRDFQRVSSTPIPILQRSFLDEVVSQAFPYVQWATLQFTLASDSVVRRGKLWAAACTPDNQPTVIPSVDLLAAGLIQGIPPEQLQTALLPFQPQSCDVEPVLVSNPVEMLGLKLRDTEQTFGRRIMYKVPWMVDNQLPKSPQVILDSSGIPFLKVFSAFAYAKSPPQASLKGLTDNVVVIGNSKLDMYHTFNSPLGTMSVPLMVINTLYSLLKYKELEPPTLFKGILIMCILIGVMTTLFSLSSRMGLNILAGVAVVFLILPVSMITFQYVTWLNFAVPLFILILYRVFVVD